MLCAPQVGHQRGLLVVKYAKLEVRSHQWGTVSVKESQEEACGEKGSSGNTSQRGWRGGLTHVSLVHWSAQVGSVLIGFWKESEYLTQTAPKKASTRLLWLWKGRNPLKQQVKTPSKRTIMHVAGL